MKIYFGIDCAPGGIRPNTHAERVFEKLGINPIVALRTSRLLRIN